MLSIRRRRADFRSFLMVVLLPLSAIWSVEFYVNQDGSLHLYNAYLILEILKGNQTVSQFVTLNPVLVPNLTGHWILAGLLSIFSAAAATKIFVSVLFAGLVASMCWLRQQVSGHSDYFTGLLLAVVLAFNWMWFLGLYNFTLGAIGFAFTLGLWWRWRDALTLWRSVIIAALLLFVFLSHLISFCALVLTLLVSCLTHARQGSSKTAIRTVCAMLPTAPLLLAYLRLGVARDTFSPVWTHLENPWSISGWLSHLRTADPFQLLGRKSLPFVDVQSKWFAIASPTLWLVIALSCLAVATVLTWKKHQAEENRNVRLWSGVGLFFCLVWLVAPDGFGVSHGWFLRERSLLLGLICLVPAFRLNDYSTLKRVAQVCLLFCVVFQSAVIWNYSLHASREAKKMMAARDSIADGDSIGSILLHRDGCQFRSTPLAHLTAFMAVGKNARLWDNAELAYYLFPVVARDDEDRRSVTLRGANGFNFCDPNDQSENRFSGLDGILQTHYDRIKVLLVWGKDERLDEIVGHWYESPPFYHNEGVRLFRRR